MQLCDCPTPAMLYTWAASAFILHDSSYADNKLLPAIWLSKAVSTTKLGFCCPPLAMSKSLPLLLTLLPCTVQVVGSNTTVVGVTPRDPCAGTPTSGKLFSIQCRGFEA